MEPWLCIWLALLAGVVAGSLAPGDVMPDLPNDRLLHFGAYAVLGVIPSGWAWSRSWGWKMAALASLIGVGLEILQNVIPGRTTDVADAIANCAGAITGCVMGMMIRRWQQDRSA